MFCQNCGTQIDDNVNYCPKCGKAVSSDFSSGSEVETVKMKCKTCGGTMDITTENRILVCPFCGSKEIILENENVTIERLTIKSQGQT